MVYACARTGGRTDRAGSTAWLKQLAQTLGMTRRLIKLFRWAKYAHQELPALLHEGMHAGLPRSQ